MSPKVIVKLPLNKQVLNNNRKDIRWSKENDDSLLRIIESSDISDFKITGLNIEELSTHYNVPIDFMLKKFIQLYNGSKLKTTALPQGQKDDLVHEVDNDGHDKVIPTLALQEVPAFSRIETRTSDPAKREVINPKYSYYIDKNDYSSSHESEEEDEDDSQDLMKSSDFLLHRSKILPPRLTHSSIQDFFSDRDDSEEEEVVVGYKFQNNHSTDKSRTNNNNNATITITNEDVNGIICNKKLDRKNSGASDLSNRSELEKLLLDRL